MAQCVELELENCLDEIERMQQKIQELELQLHVQRMKDAPCEPNDSDDVEDVPLDCGNLTGYEKVVASRINPSGTTTQMFALKKTIPPPVVSQCPRSATLPLPAKSPGIPPVSRSAGSRVGDSRCASDISGPKPASGNVIYMKRSHETAVYRPQQSPCPGAGPGCTCPSGPVHSDPQCKDRPAVAPCLDAQGQPQDPLRACQVAPFPFGAGPTSTKAPCAPVSSQSPCPPTSTRAPCAVVQPKSPCGAVQPKSPCGAVQPKSPCGAVPPKDPCGAAAKKCQTKGRVTAAEQNENPFAILGTMIECSDSQPAPVGPDPACNVQKTEEEEKLEDVVNFINYEIFPILIEAVKGIIDRVDGSDVCFCLGKSMENENDFNEAIRQYRNVSKGINCFMQDILKSLSTKLAERSKKYSPQMELLLQGRGVVEQAEIALSEEIGRAIGREENVVCPNN